ncbi:lipopolysaccharide biosynthesis protein [Photobacterium leiognathi]|uniref:lipopolysaccharide biosynthesis protein n=1 Tax=Photobacterium leiognathi TaxID=553611 RepID=UPI0029818FB8|nr:oligosaccharide flippase family protein [Photobacterium leiognathi]
MRFFFRTLVSIIGSRLLSAILTFLTSLLVLKFSSIEEYGKYFFSLSIITLFTTLPNIGINNKFIYSHIKNEKVNYYLVAKVIIILLLLFLSFFINTIYQYDYIFCVLSGLSISLFESVLTLLQAREKFTKYSLYLPIKSVIILILTFILVNNDFDPIFAYYCFSLISVLIFIIYCFNELRDLVFEDLSKAYGLVTLSAGFLLFELSALLIIRAETWLLKYFTDLSIIQSESLGIYGTIFSICTGLSIVSNSVISLLLPKIRENRSYLEKSKLILMFLSGLVFCIVYYSLSVYVIKFIKPEILSITTKYMMFIVFGMLLSFMGSLFRLKLVNDKREKELNYIYISQLIITLVFGASFIYIYGVSGAFISFFIVRLYGTFIMWYKIKS